MAIDAIVVLFFKNGIVDYYKREIEAYIKLYKSEGDKHLPSYIKIVETQQKPEGYVLYRLEGSKYVFVNIDRIKNKLLKFLYTLLLWEFALSLTVILIVHFLLKKMLKYKHESEEFLRFVVLSLSHKLGNFIAAQKVNIEMIGSDVDAIERLKAVVDEFECDLNLLKSVIKFEENLKPEETNICKELEELKNVYEDKSVAILVECDNIRVKLNSADFKIVVDELFRNAYKYSMNFVKVKVWVDKKVVMSIENDIKDISTGSGLGLKIVEYVAKRNRWFVDYKVEGNIFKVVVIFG